MASDEFQLAARQLIWASIDSIHKLEVLLLARSRPERTWDPSSMGRELRIDARSAATSLTELAERGLLVRDAGETGLYRYAPSSAEAAAVDALADAYLTRRVAVVELIYQGPQAKIRGFAEAFRIRKEGDDDG